MVLVIGLAVAILAIADVGPFSDPQTEEDRVADTVERFFAAASVGEFEDYCALLTDDARTTVEQNATRLLGGDQRLECPAVLAAVPEAFAGLSARIRQVAVSGPQARVEANVKTENTQGTEARTILLDQDARGVWRISDPG